MSRMLQLHKGREPRQALPTVKPTCHLAAEFLVARQKWPGRVRLMAGPVAAMEDAFLCIRKGRSSASHSARGSLSQPAHPCGTGHLPAPLNNMLTSVACLFAPPVPGGRSAYRAGRSHGGDSWAVERRRLFPTTRNQWAALVEKLQPLKPPLSFGFKTDTYACMHAHRNVMYRQIRGALRVRGINSRRQIALRLC